MNREPILQNRASAPSRAFSVRIVSTDAERLAVYRFRYRVYVEEMRRAPHDADHERRVLTDALDPTGRLFAAFEGDEVVGTVRLNSAAESDLEYYEGMYQMTGLAGADLANSAMGTALMVAPRYRGTSLALRLVRMLVREMASRGLRFLFVDCNAHLVSYYQRLGGRIHRPRVEHPDYGEVTVLYLDLADAAWLEASRSPLRNACA